MEGVMARVTGPESTVPTALSTGLRALDEHAIVNELRGAFRGKSQAAADVASRLPADVALAFGRLAPGRQNEVLERVLNTEAGANGKSARARLGSELRTAIGVAGARAVEQRVIEEKAGVLRRA